MAAVNRPVSEHHHIARLHGRRERFSERSADSVNVERSGGSPFCRRAPARDLLVWEVVSKVADHSLLGSLHDSNPWCIDAAWMKRRPEAKHILDGTLDYPVCVKTYSPHAVTDLAHRENGSVVERRCSSQSGDAPQLVAIKKSLEVEAAACFQVRMCEIPVSIGGLIDALDSLPVSIDLIQRKDSAEQDEAVFLKFSHAVKRVPGDEPPGPSLKRRTPTPWGAKAYTLKPPAQIARKHEEPVNVRRST